MGWEKAKKEAILKKGAAINRKEANEKQREETKSDNRDLPPEEGIGGVPAPLSEVFPILEREIKAENSHKSV